MRNARPLRPWLRAAAVAVALLGARAVEGKAPARPRLVVLVVVDQMRADYAEWYGARWTGGLRRLYDGGAVFTNARYPYASTLTCPGHFTLSTGAYPHRHGMVANGWYDHALRKMVDCTDDPAARPLHYPPLPPLPPSPRPASPAPASPPAAARSPAGDSARRNLVPTLADEMRARLAPKPRVAAFSIKARSAIGVAGKAPGVVLWLEQDRWVTSSAFSRARTPWVQRFVAAHPVPAPTPEHLKRWAISPAPDDYLAQLATAALTEMKLGRGPGTDYLAVSFSMTDLIGHRFGPRSAEVQESLAHLDGSLGRLLETLDRRVGAANYVLALSADHGVAPVPEEARAAGQAAGRLLPSDLFTRTEAILVAELGGRDLVAATPGNDIYLSPGVYQRLQAKPGAMARVLAALRAIPGVAHAFEKSELGDPAAARDPLRKAAALSYHPARSGELTLVHTPNWVVGAAGTNHGSVHAYDQHVPVIFFGAGIPAGRFDRAITPADVAPTLARLVGVPMPHAQGTPAVEVVGAAK